MHFDDYFRNILRTKTRDETLDIFHEVCEQFGFPWVFYATNIAITQRGEGESNSYVKIPVTWKTKYYLKNYVLTDPVLKWCVEGNRPATWRSIAASLDENHHPIWADAQKYNIVDGIAFNIILSDKIGVLSLGSIREVDQAALSTMLVMGRLFGAKIHFQENGLEVPDDLSHLDLNILNLVLQGYSDKEIAEITNNNRQLINRRINKYMQNTATNNRYRAALILNWIGKI